LKNKGFSLLEVLIGLVILAVGILAIAALQTTSVRGNFFSHNLMQGTYVAQDRLEFLKNVSYDHAALSVGDHPENPVIIRGMTFNDKDCIRSEVKRNSGYNRLNEAAGR